jgi:outer membrane protein assembly factor BamB
VRRGLRRRLCAGGLVLVAGLVLAACGADPISVRVLEADDAFTLGDGSGSAELLALDPATGETLWSIPVPEPDSFTTTPALVAAGDRVVVATWSPSGAVAVGLADGRPLWQAEVSGAVRAMGRAAGRTVLDTAWGTGTSRLFALDDATGEAVWEVRREPAAGPAIIEEDLIVLADRVPRWVEAVAPGDGSTSWTQYRAGGYWAWSDGSQVFAVGDAGELVALDQASGEVRWAQPGLQPYWLASGDRYVVGWFDFGGGDSSFVAAASADDGHVLWSDTLNGSVDVDVIGETVILTQTRANDHEWLIALDAGTGRRLWTRACELETVACRCSVAGAAGDVVFVSLASRLAALDLATGAEVWSVALQDEVGRALVAGGRVFVGTTTGVASTGNAGTITALDPADGSILWQRYLPIGVPYQPVLVGSQLLVLAHNPTPAAD